MHELNVLNLPLQGVNLIEASAGTGKTYVVTILYLRLLLHLEKKSAFFRPLTIQEILVVTFTNAAAQSLRDRIQQNIRQFRLDCIRGYSDHDIFAKLLTQIHDINHAIHQLLEAETHINQASIFTIHGFCQRILSQHSIELNVLFNTFITNNEMKLYKQICIDFWTRRFHVLPLNILYLIQEYWIDSNALLQEIFPYIYGEKPTIKNSIFSVINEDIPAYYAQIIINIKNIKMQWHENAHNIATIINHYNINRKIYNIKNLNTWIDKINQWTQHPTKNHIIPHDLQRFRTSTLHAYNNHHHDKMYTCPLFDAIEKLYLQRISFKTLIFNIAINDIRTDLKKNKHITSELTFNDLINLLSSNLEQKKQNNLAHTIRTNYPITIIDEFQDTDQQQYKIFHMLYHNYTKNSLIFIGDPKQAIYSFRGADIFTYITARQTIFKKYTLSMNWRSSSNMINAINQLFQYKAHPFIFEDIPFIPATPTKYSNTYKFLINNRLQTAICFWVHPEKMVTINNYKTAMAQECAITLHNLLLAIQNKTAWIEKNNEKRILRASDITILVRNHKEASLMQTVLSKLNISTVFLSNQKNIFETAESYDLLLLLQAILFLDHKMICTALTTIFFTFNAANIEHINKHTLQLEKIINEFSEYYFIWKKKGIYSMICTILFKNKIPKILLSSKIGEDKLINILHLSELLQNISMELKDTYELMQWFLLKMTSTKHEHVSSEQLLRLNSNYQVIKISTIHKSKGLEFPLTFLPFMANFRFQQTPVFHDRRSYLTCLDFNQLTLSHKKLIDEERLSEDLRLLYVAITRSIYHCSIGIAPIIYKYKKKSNIHDLHRCALGYLIQKNIAGNSDFLRKNLEILSTRSYGDISFRYIKKSQKFPAILPITNNNKKNLLAKSWTISLDNKPWTITSYSQLKNSNTTTTHYDLDKQFNTQKYLHHTINDIQLTPHTFPQGKVCGNFFHHLFALLDFTQPISQTWLTTQIKKYYFDPHWNIIIQKWIHTVINTPLNQKNLTLSQINHTNKKTELEFYLPINTDLTAKQLDLLCKNYDSLSAKSPKLVFTKIKGMLQGFIDLIFFWNKKYYLLDYKTNWLGENFNAYTYSNMEQEMIKQCYMLQYQFYTLALHRFLRHRVTSYDYKKDFGGIYYLFIRGMDGTKLSNGIYFIPPLSPIFIKKIDNLFFGK